MVNISVIELINKLIVEGNVKQMKRWSDRYRSTTQKIKSGKLLAKIRSILMLISGNDIIEMLKSVLSNNEIDQLVPKKYINSLGNISSYYHKVNLKERHNLIKPLRNGGLSFENVRELGFKVSKQLWNKCLENVKRNQGGRPINHDLIDDCKIFLKNNTRVSSGRVHKGKDKVLKAIRYLNDSKIELFKKFKGNNPQINRTSFHKYLKNVKHIKKITRKTDVCDFCDWFRIKSKIILNFCASFNDYQASEFFISSDIREFLEKKKKEPTNLIQSERISLMIDHLINCEAVQIHRNNAQIQREAYKFHRTDKEFLKEKIIIDIDFKQKIIIGLSPIQCNAEYYNLDNRTCLGFGITYLENDQIKTINFDLITKCYKGSQDAESAVRAFKVLRNQDFFKKIETKEYVVWADCGKHFRNKLFVGFLFNELKTHEIKVNLNFFVEKHGKSSRDTHFACVTRFIKSESLLRRLESSKDVVEAIMNGQKKSNINRALKGLAPIITIAFELTDLYAEELDKIKYFGKSRALAIDHLESSYNYRRYENNKVVTSVLSNSNNCIPIRAKFKDIEVVANHSLMIEIPLTKSSIKDITFLNLRKKNQYIAETLSKIKDDMDLIEGLRNLRGSSNIVSMVTDLPEQSFQISKTKPEFCKRNSVKIKGCMETCKQNCAYNILDLKNTFIRPTQRKIRDELIKHGHPSYRTMPNKNSANTQDQCKELADHYQFAHGK